MAKLAVLLLLVLISTHSQALVKPNKANRRSLTPQIVGGDISPLGAFPHQISFRSSGRDFCSGSIISSEFIVTAAQCCDANLPDLSIRAGLNNIANPEDGFQEFLVGQAIIHPNYNSSSLVNDVCILRLTNQLVLSNGTRTAAIQLPQEGYTATGSAVVSGWGTTREGGQLSETLMNVTVPIVTDTVCRERYGQDAIADSMICAGEEGKDSCTGDTGGPLVNSQGLLVGVVTGGNGCGSKEFPGVYTEMSAHVQWISETIAHFH